MFGIGSFIKRGGRRANDALFKLRGNLLLEEPCRFYQVIQAETIGMDYLFHLDRSRRWLYVEVPKAACTTLKLLLLDLRGLQRPADPLTVHARTVSRLQSPRMVGLRHFQDIATAPDALRFTFVRHPVDRLLSCYRDKFQPYPLGTGGGAVKFARRHFGRALAGMDQDAPLPLEAFLDMACATARTPLNGHWLAMDLIVPKSLEFHLVGKVEHLAEDVGRLLRLMGEERGLPEGLACVNATAAAGTPSVDRQALRRIETAYAADFERFDYDPERYGDRL
ncbi:sulfotransferase family 2 domain-containing protein [Polymorphum gilvum]|uniref:Carbohydrate sulfotransferase 11 n=1 Tax=Polymorphum gilvum (strain LMG 25793 / CGMCC 1.9160 / SL003B-26A1) TaxID=991905 RepID=F2IUX3_POLGS|nr:sulfotransferase family 2 domain-containing protein [Polymorphum gilvum]ADZ70202.1 Carbohydrate sulfotransferase 11 [Polymorphum gilvum SL003B-26A1]